MTDEYYQKKRLEEMRKQTECMEEQNKLLEDIKDIGRLINLKLSVLSEESVKRGGISDIDAEIVSNQIVDIQNEIKKRWSE